ncbi:MAG: hypothetical protein ACI9XC_002364 [Gammaproteobacteria bacterium]|jgi:hypothetical protein
MSIFEIILSQQFLVALLIYGILIAIIFPLSEHVYRRLQNSVLEWMWDHIAMPLIQAGMLMFFVLLTYPVIFGIEHAPAISLLLSQDDLRINHLVNLLFIISLLFPLVPVVGNWNELILPVQGIAGSMMIFSWMVSSLGVTQYSYWPGWDVMLYCMVLGVITHWLAILVAHFIGNKIDKFYNVLGSGELFSRGLILLLQSPVILLFSAGLGRQLV